VQIPYLETEECEEYLQPYKKERKPHETPANESTEGSDHQQLTNKIQNLFKESTGTFSIQTEFEPNQHNQPSHETTHNGWFLLASKEGKGSNVSVHHQPLTDPSQKQ
jgi:hypothetical protein